MALTITMVDQINKYMYIAVNPIWFNLIPSMMYNFDMQGHVMKCQVNFVATNRLLIVLSVLK